MEAHHYVSQLNEDVHHDIIFVGDGKDGKIMESNASFRRSYSKRWKTKTKKLWHLHHYEVKSGTLIAPGIPAIAKHELMEKIIATDDQDNSNLTNRPTANVTARVSYDHDGLYKRRSVTSGTCRRKG